MNFNVKAWLGQVTTGHGAMILGPTLLAAASGQMDWTAAVPLLIAGVIGLLWPENTGLKAAAQQTASDIEALVAAYRTGLVHGGVVLPPAPGAAPQPAARSDADLARKIAGALSTTGAMVVLCVLALGLAGCTQPPTSATGASATAATAGPLQTVSNDVQTLNAITNADLAQAIAEAQAANPPDTQAVACFTFIQTNLAALQGQVAAVKAPVGAFSAFETANLALGSAGTTLAPAMKTAAENACGPLVLHVENGALTVAQEVAALLAALGIKVAVPAAAAVPGL